LGSTHPPPFGVDSGKTSERTQRKIKVENYVQFEKLVKNDT